MAANAHAALAVEAAFALSFAARVLEYHSSVAGIDVLENHVGNELLVAGVLFGHRPRQEADVFRAEQFLEVPIHVPAKALKVSQRVKDGRGNHKHLFDLKLGHEDLRVARLSCGWHSIAAARHNASGRRNKQPREKRL